MDSKIAKQDTIAKPKKLILMKGASVSSLDWKRKAPALHHGTQLMNKATNKIEILAKQMY